MQLLKLLADGEIHSGVKLAEELSISRMTVSNRVAEWVAKGVAIETLAGRGYRLAFPIQLLDEKALNLFFKNYEPTLVPVVRLEECVSSTNDVVTQCLGPGVTRVVCLAEHQESGRGRRGRKWFTAPGSSFCGSFGWRLTSGIHSLEGLSLAVGVELLEVLRKFGYSGIQLKWPNDLITDKGKLGGVLIEISGEAEGPCDVVIGIGLNWRLPEHIKSSVPQPVSDLVSLGANLPDRNHLTADIIMAISGLLDSFVCRGFEDWRERWLKNDAYAGKEVELTGGIHPVLGVAMGIDKHGALLIKNESGIRAYHGGELSLREAGRK